MLETFVRFLSSHRFTSHFYVLYRPGLGGGLVARRPLAYLLDAVAARVGVEATTREFDDPMIRLLSLWLKS